MADGRGWSYWSRNKLEILEGYLPAFNRASKSAPERIYLDLMAGGPLNVDKASGAQFDGSARLALSADPGFTRFAFGELPKNAAALEADLRGRFPRAPFRVYPGDCNQQVGRMLADLWTARRAPTFAFLDQQSAELHWETMAAISEFRLGKTKAEQWILWSPAMLARNLMHGEVAARVDRMYGSSDWRRIATARESKAIGPAQFRSEMVNLLRWRLENVLGYVHTIRVPMTMSTSAGAGVNGIPLYDMVFATDHDAGLRIMSHLYASAVEREPRMKAEAIAAQTGQDSLFPVEVKVPEWKSEPCWDPATRSWW